uniref:RING-type E3 ubiquitin transferase n=1 Tax=Parastrongyloides trichosuri TaxID=131310 RepID=A0A0N5A1L8_PARTI
MDNRYYCHNCREPVRLSATDIVCSKCNGGFVEPLQDFYANNPNVSRVGPMFSSQGGQNSGPSGGPLNATAFIGIARNFQQDNNRQNPDNTNNSGAGSSNTGSNLPNQQMPLFNILTAINEEFQQQLARNQQNQGTSERSNSSTRAEAGSEVSSLSEADSTTQMGATPTLDTNEGTPSNNPTNTGQNPQINNVLSSFINNIFPRVLAAQGLRININNSEIPTPPNTTNNSEASTTNATNANNSPNHQERNDDNGSNTQQQNQQQRTGILGLLGQLNNLFNRRSQQNQGEGGDSTANVNINRNEPGVSTNNSEEGPRTENNGSGNERRPEIARVIISLQGSNDGIVLNVAPGDESVSLSTEDLIPGVTEVLRNAMSTGSENLSTELNTATFQNIVRDITRLIDDPQRGNILDVSGNSITLGISPNEHAFEGILRMVENIDEVAHARRNRLTEAEIARIPIVQVSEEQIINESQCTVCMDIFIDKDSVYKLACNHIFHKQCLTPWVQTHRSCPVCRQEIKPYDFPDPVLEENFTDDMELD